MKRILLVLIYCALCTLHSAYSQGYWTQKATFWGKGRQYPFSFSIGTKGYVGCGWDTAHTVTPHFWEYDPTANTWSQKADFGGVGRVAGTAFTIGNKGYAGLGVDAGFATLKDFWEYDPATNGWTQKAIFGGVARYAAVGFSIGNKGFISTGSDLSASFYNDLWEYDALTDTWTQKTSLPGLGREDANGFAVGNNGYVIAGILSSLIYTTELWEYNSVTDSWSQKASLPAGARCDAAAFSICNKGYFGTGEVGSGNYGADFWQYDPVANSWLRKADFPGLPRDEPFGFSISGKGYIGLGGKDGYPTYNDFWEFTPDSTCGQSLPTAHFISSDTAFCSETGTCIDFTDHSTGSPTSWKWYFPGAIPDSSILQNPANICYYTPGTYAVTLIVTNSAGADTLTVSPMITFGATPPAPVITKNNDTLICSHASSYQWYFNGAPIAAATDSFYIAFNYGSYSVYITDSLGCGRFGNSVLASIGEYGERGVEIYVYPNPARSELSVMCAECRGKEEMVEVYNVLGEKVLSQQQETRNKKQETVIDVSSLKNGIYILQIDLENRIINKKFVVLH